MICLDTGKKCFKTKTKPYAKILTTESDKKGLITRWMFKLVTMLHNKYLISVFIL